MEENYILKNNDDDDDEDYGEGEPFRKGYDGDDDEENE